VPSVADAPDGYHLMAGYRAAGQRAIRIDMLERLADMLRSEDTRGGFEAKADMLSITGMTLEQFADLMQGLGYKAEKGEREKVKAVAAPDQAAGTPQEASQDAAAPHQAPADQSSADPAPQTDADAPAPEAGTAAPDAEAAAPEMEVFYTFAWGGARQQRHANARPRKQGGAPKGKGGKGKPRGDKPQGAKQFSARPPKAEKKIDPLQ